MTASLSLPHAPAFSQACPPEEEAVPERLWRVHRIPEAVVRVDTGSGVKNAGYFAVPFVSNDLGTLAINDDFAVTGTYLKQTASGGYALLRTPDERRRRLR
jgi:hypothetical protein